MEKFGIKLLLISITVKTAPPSSISLRDYSLNGITKASNIADLLVYRERAIYLKMQCLRNN